MVVIRGLIAPKGNRYVLTETGRVVFELPLAISDVHDCEGDV
jgi:hypothetical protein